MAEREELEERLLFQFSLLIFHCFSFVVPGGLTGRRPAKPPTANGD